MSTDKGLGTGSCTEATRQSRARWLKCLHSRGGIWVIDKQASKWMIDFTGESQEKGEEGEPKARDRNVGIITAQMVLPTSLGCVEVWPGPGHSSMRSGEDGGPKEKEQAREHHRSQEVFQGGSGRPCGGY